MPNRTFELPTTDAETEGVDPVWFELSYKRRTPPAGKAKAKWVAESQRFDCVAFQPAYAVRFLSSHVVADSALMAINYIERCLATDEDAARFLVLINSREIMLRGEELGDILEWLTETYSERPTGKPSPSGDGRGEIGDILTGDS